MDNRVPSPGYRCKPIRKAVRSRLSIDAGFEVHVEQTEEEAELRPDGGKVSYKHLECDH